MGLRPILRRVGRCVVAAALAGAPAVAPVAGPPPAVPTPAAQAAGAVPGNAQEVALHALGLLGVQYRLGGSTPEAGLDCSGLVRYVFQEVTGVSLPRTSKEMSFWGTRVGPAELMPGDLVFFDTRRAAFSHVGIYVGDNRFVHAPSRGADVRLSELTAYWRKHFNGARRLVGTSPPGKATAATATSRAPAVVAAAPYLVDPADATP